MVVRYTKDGRPAYIGPPYTKAEKKELFRGLNDTPIVVGRYRSPKANSSTSRSRESNIPAKASSLDAVEPPWPLSDNAARVLDIFERRRRVDQGLA